MTVLTKTLLEEWPQIQTVDSAHAALFTRFAGEINQITHQRPNVIQGADFNELTRVLYEQAEIPPDSWTEIFMSDIKNCRSSLSEAGKKAADITLSDHTAISNLSKHGDRLITKIEGPKFSANSYERPHVDGSDVAVLRYSGPKLRTYHQSGVENLHFIKFNAAVNDDAKVLDTEHGHIWVNRGKSGLTIKSTESFPFARLEPKRGGVHAKGEPNGEPGLVTISDLVR